MGITAVYLTGKERYRTNLFGKIILQVEEQVQWEDNNFPYNDAPAFRRWRDAKLHDLKVKGEIKND